MYWRAPSDQTPSNRPTVVLVHGYVVSSRYMVPAAAKLAAHATVYAPDLPGHGRSEKPPTALDVRGLADALTGWAEALALPPAIYIGNSFGCQVVTELAARRSDLVRALILLGPTIDRTARNAVQQGWRLARDFRRESGSLFMDEIADLIDMGVPLALEELQVMLADRIEDRLPRIHQPVLVQRGAEDIIVPAPWAREVARLLPNAEFMELPDAPHAANVSTPTTFVHSILPFLARV